MAKIYNEFDRLPALVRQYVAVALAGGNSGLDLEPVMDYLLLTYPNANKNILVTGGLDEDIEGVASQTASPGAPPVKFNSAGGTLMLFAPGTVGNSAGTSFSAPQGASIMASLLKINPNWTGDHLVSMMKTGSRNVTSPASPIPGLTSYNLLPSIEEALIPAPTIYTAPIIASASFGGPCPGTQSINGTLSTTLQGNPYLPTTSVPVNVAAVNPSYYAHPITGPISFTGTITVSLATCTGLSGPAPTTGAISGSFQSFIGYLQPEVNGNSYPAWWDITVTFTGNSFSHDLKTLTGNVSADPSCFSNAPCSPVLNPITFTKQ